MKEIKGQTYVLYNVGMYHKFSTIHCKYLRWDYDGILNTDAAEFVVSAVANYRST